MDETTILILLLVGFLAIVMLCVMAKGKESFAATCASKCSDPDDFWECCDCEATITNDPMIGGSLQGEENYEQAFRQCMCNHGDNDYCFHLETNFLLSQ